MNVRVAVADYGMGNRRSVQKALEHVGATVSITSDPAELASCQGVVIPGVGAFPRAMQNLRERRLVEPVQELARGGMPILGICLGMQLLFEVSEEIEQTPGLGLLAGRVTWLRDVERLPHIGWNEVRFERASALLKGLPPGGCPFYHVHSLAARPEHPEDVIATTAYGERFATVVQRANVAGVQFHPEKSSAHGLRLLANFLEVCATPAARAPGVAAPA